MNCRKIMLSLLLLFSAGYAFSQNKNKLAPGDHYAEVNGIKLHYIVSGKGPVCLMPSPGWGAHVNVYVNSLKPFEQYFTMVYYDTRKSGLSSGPDDPKKYTDQDFVNDMDALRAYLDQPKVWIAGHSGGGYQVLNYGTQHNDQLSGIIALDALVKQDSMYAAELAHIIETTKKDPIFEQAKKELEIFDRDTLHTVQEKLAIILPLYFSNQHILKGLPSVKVSEAAYQYTQASNIYSSKDLLADLHKIKVPVWIVVGDEDFICGPESQAKRIHERISSSELLIVKGVGHFPWLEKPDVFYGSFKEWIKKIS